jgi:hypothetical protein
MWAGSLVITSAKQCKQHCKPTEYSTQYSKMSQQALVFHSIGSISANKSSKEPQQYATARLLTQQHRSSYGKGIASNTTQTKKKDFPIASQATPHRHKSQIYILPSIPIWARVFGPLPLSDAISVPAAVTGWATPHRRAVAITGRASEIITGRRSTPVVRGLHMPQPLDCLPARCGAAATCDCITHTHVRTLPVYIPHTLVYIPHMLIQEVRNESFCLLNHIWFYIVDTQLRFSM